MKLKITKTLIESWAYTFDAAEDYADEAMEDFLATLKRDTREPNEAMIAGTNFENLVYRIAGAMDRHPNEECRIECSPDEAQWLDGAKKIAKIIEGGQIQVPVSCDLTLAGQDFWLYGICDVVKAGVIYDVKYRTTSLGSNDVYGKYLHCSQHPLYLKALPEASRFDYLVSDGKELYVESYTREESEPIEDHILNFWAWLHTKPDLMEIYKEKWVVDA